MINSLKFLILTLVTRLLQIVTVSVAILKNQISFYPKSVKKFEAKFREVSCCSQSLMFCNATSAMEAALFSVGVVTDSNVGTTAFVIPSSYAPAKSLGANIKFIDLSLESLNFDVEKLEHLDVTLFALIVTHFYGNPCDMERIMSWAQKNDVFVIEDCSHAHGAICQGKPVGTWGHVGIFSLQGAKAVAAGEGAIAISNNSELMLKMAAYGHQQSFRKFNIKTENNLNLPDFGFGRKMRAHPLGAVLAIEDFKMLKIKNSIFSAWTRELEALSKKSVDFRLPSVLEASERGGFCQGIPFILENKDSADKLKKLLLSSRVSCFSRDYTAYIMQFSKIESEHEVRSELPISYNAFSQVLFIPFEQFVLPWRWAKLKSTLKRLHNE